MTGKQKKDEAFDEKKVGDLLNDIANLEHTGIASQNVREQHILLMKNNGCFLMYPNPWRL